VAPDWTFNGAAAASLLGMPISSRATTPPSAVGTSRSMSPRGYEGRGPLGWCHRVISQSALPTFPEYCRRVRVGLR
jgi:hypothetical protein